MKIDELRKEITLIKKDAKSLSEEVGTLLMQHNITIGKRAIDAPLLKTSADLFSKRERDLIDQLGELYSKTSNTYTEINKELAELRRSAKTDLLYIELITSEGVIGREELESQLQTEATKAESLFRLINDAIFNLCEVGWNRYFKRLDEEAVLSEIKALADAFRVVEEPIGESGFLEEATSKNLLALLETDYYKTINRFIVPESYSTLSADSQMRILRAAVEPCFQRHIEALDEDGQKRAEEIISGLVDRLFMEYGTPTAITDLPTESFYTAPADTYFYYNDKVSNQLTLLEAGKERPLKLESDRDEKKGKSVTTLVTLNFDELSTTDSNIKLSAPILDRIDNYDREIINAVFTAWQTAENSGEVVAGEAVTTLQTLYRYMTKNPSSTLTEEIEQDLTTRLTKLSAGIIKINASAEAVYYKQLANFERTGALMNIVIDKAYVNGNLVNNAVHIIRLDRSPLHLYAKTKGQIGSVPLKKLDTRTVNKNEEMIVIEAYLIRRINSQKLNNLIVIDTLFDEAGIVRENYKDFNQKRKAVIKKIRALLVGYVNTAFIKGYEFISKGRAKYYGIKIKK